MGAQNGRTKLSSILLIQLLNFASAVLNAWSKYVGCIQWIINFPNVQFEKFIDTLSANLFPGWQLPVRRCSLYE